METKVDQAEISNNGDTERSGISDIGEYRTGIKRLVETEIQNLIDEEIKSASQEILEEQRKAIRQLVEEHRLAIKEVVEEEKKAIWGRLEDLRKSILSIKL